MGIFVFDLLRKREHTRNKMYKRLLKNYTENEVLDMICDSRMKCYYEDFFNWSQHAVRINDFYRTLGPDLHRNCSVQEIYDGIMDVCNGFNT
jgi:hypothetical protein